jgi:Fe-S-cluster-containing hydrogenase component 2
MGIDVCEKVCPVSAISGDIRQVHKVDQQKCIGCGMCESRCPKKAITMVQVAAADKKPAKSQEPVAV